MAAKLIHQTSNPQLLAVLPLPLCPIGTGLFYTPNTLPLKQPSAGAYLGRLNVKKTGASLMPGLFLVC
jgi:hypothetical protein